MKVDFAICGAQKAGTTALDAYLRRHPEICMANAKEAHFFDSEVFFQRDEPDYSIYHSAFDRKPSHRFVGEATPIYMYWYDAPRRLWRYNPDMKLIVILRNPIERAYSDWNMERSRNSEALSFWDAIRFEPQRRREALPYQLRRFSYVDRGFYTEQLRRLWTYFPEEQVLVLRTESLKSKPHETLQEVCDFLGASRFGAIEVGEVHSRPYLAPLGDREKEYLRHIFEYEIRGLERLLGWDLSDWLRD